MINTLGHPDLQSVSVELDDSRGENVERVARLMDDAGLTLVGKKHWPMSDGAETQSIYNFVYSRRGDFS